MKFLLMVIMINILPTDTFKIDSLLKCLNVSQKVTCQIVKGKFEYIQSDAEQNIYTSIFKSDSLILFHTLYGDTNIKDTLVIGDNIIAIDNKYDPLSIEVAYLNFKGEHYLCLLGKSVSASGSGVQVSFYTLLKMKGKKVVQSYFFQSRFGDFLNVGDFNNDNKLDYIKIVNGDQQNKYIAKLYSVKTDSPVENNNLVLVYNGNDFFSLLEANWFKKVDLNCIINQQNK